MVKRFVITVLILLAVVDLSYAAGRIIFDDFESYSAGTLPTTLWSQDTPNPLCTVVTSAADGILGPYAGSKMLRCDSTGSNNGQTAYLNTSNYTNELFIRLRLRLDDSHVLTSGSPRKILRFFTWSDPVYRDLFGGLGSGSTGIQNAAAWSDVGLGGNVNVANYWGDNSSDHTITTTSWHTIEYYFNHSQSRAKVWHDGVVVRNSTQNGDGDGFGASKWKDFYITSNWEDAHSAGNYVYFDSFEVYSDNGTGGTGLMSDASITQGGAPAPAVMLRRRQP